MKFYTQKNENFFDVKCDNGDITFKIGCIEKPYHNMDFYVATDSNSGTLSDNGNFIFRDFETAKNKIIEHYKYEQEVLKNG